MNAGELRVWEPGEDPVLLLVTDVTSDEVWARDRPMSVPAWNELVSQFQRINVVLSDLAILSAAPPLNEEDTSTDTRAWKAISVHRPAFEEQVRALLDKYPNIEAIVSLGKWGASQVAGRTFRISEGHGRRHEAFDVPWFPIINVTEVLRFPDRRSVLENDFAGLLIEIEREWEAPTLDEASSLEAGYEWCLDLTEVLANRPLGMAVDTETTGLDTEDPDFRVLTVALSFAEGKALVVPLDIRWWNDASLFSHASAEKPRLSERLRTRLLAQLKSLIEDPEIRVTGHNLSYDVKALKTLGIEVGNWFFDTIQGSFALDDNMLTRSLSDCVKRWLPSHAGYSDVFDAETDKGKMAFKEHGPFLGYAGGDADVTYRLTVIMAKMLRKDSRQWATFEQIQMPALRAFAKMEDVGVRVDTSALKELEIALGERERELYHEIFALVPPKVLKKHEGRWTVRAELVVDALFGPDGIRVTPSGEIVGSGPTGPGEKLEPLVFTKSGDISTSAKDHFPYFEHVELVRLLMEYSKVQKMISTYVGHDAGKEVSRVKRLKGGGLPVQIERVLEAGGVPFPTKAKNLVRRRTPDPMLADTIRSGNTLRLPAKGKTVVLDEFGNVTVETEIPPTGFWQHLRNRDDGFARIHPHLALHKTNTGRTAGSNPNPQNLPKRGKLAKAFRKVFVPTPGYRFVAADESQIELRVAACMSGDETMISLFAQGKDIHTMTAASVMGIDYEVVNQWKSSNEPVAGNALAMRRGAESWLGRMDADLRETVTLAEFVAFRRFGAKAVNFGFLYGMGSLKFQSYARTDYGLTFTEAEAEQIRATFFSTYPGLERWHRNMRDYVRKHGYVRALHGALRRLPNVSSQDAKVRAACERQAVNAPVQRFGSDVGLLACSLLSANSDLQVHRPILFVHDEIVTEALIDDVEMAGAHLKWVMENPPLEELFDVKLQVPLVAEVSVGDSLDAMEEFHVEAVKPEWVDWA